MVMIVLYLALFDCIAYLRPNRHILEYYNSLSKCCKFYSKKLSFPLPLMSL